MKNRKIKITAIVLLTLILSINFISVFATDEVQTFGTPYCIANGHTMRTFTSSGYTDKGSSGHLYTYREWKDCIVCIQCYQLISYNQYSESHSINRYDEGHTNGGDAHYYSDSCVYCSYSKRYSLICKGPCIGVANKHVTDVIE